MADTTAESQQHQPPLEDDAEKSRRQFLVGVKTEMLEEVVCFFFVPL
jgi:hypothetical protein